MAEGEPSSNKAFDFSKEMQIDGETYYQLSSPAEVNPCAGKADGTSCGAGCICKGGQCWYSLRRIKEMGIKLPPDL